MTRRVAITGYAFRFPGTDRTRYWTDLLEGRNLVTEVAADRWARESFLHPSKSHPGTSYTFAAGSLGDVSRFDAAYFGISPREASLMDPQQRLLLELSAEALENSGMPASSVRMASLTSCSFSRIRSVSKRITRFGTMRAMVAAWACSSGNPAWVAAKATIR